MITTSEVASTIKNNPPFALMHGPTFMANPLALSAAIANIKFFKNIDWLSLVQGIERELKGLEELKDSRIVKDVRVLGNIGVVEVVDNRYLKALRDFAIENGVFLRPFNRLFYTIPPYITSKEDIKRIVKVMKEAVKKVECEDKG